LRRCFASSSFAIQPGGGARSSGCAPHRDQPRRHHRRGWRCLWRRRQYRSAARGARRAGQRLRLGDRPRSGRRQTRFRFRRSRPEKPQEYQRADPRLSDGDRRRHAVNRARPRRRCVACELRAARRSPRHRGLAVREFQQRSGAGVLCRRHHRRQAGALFR